VRTTLAILLLLTAAAVRAQPAPLHSPWDNLRVDPSSAPWTCPAAPHFVQTVVISSYYIDPHASVIDPTRYAEFQQASADSTHLAQYATLAADAYLAKGSRPAVLCVFSLLDAAAKSKAWSGKMPGFQGVYLQNWLLSAVAVAYLKVRPTGLATPEQDRDIQTWFAALAARVRDYFDAEVIRIGLDRENNHLYWAGLAVGAAGIADNHPPDFQWGLTAYRMGLDAIQPDGSLPREMDRAQMALHYQLYALAPLVMIAELGAADGLDLYAEDHGAIHRLVAFDLAGLEDPTAIEKRTGIAQVVSLPYAGSDIGWAVPYVHRFPNARLSALIAKAPWVRSTTWGGAPPD
jgi:poly(beta-D-mannuronate) lyase